MADFGDDSGDATLRIIKFFLRSILKAMKDKMSNPDPQKNATIVVPDTEQADKRSKPSEPNMSHKTPEKDVSSSREDPVYMQDVEAIVLDAAERSGGDPEQFINICREQGLEVGEASDGTLKFTHPNGWFEVRADTLTERIENSREREAFERGVGEKSEDLSQQAVEEQERYIQSHDGGDVDTRTRVNESVTKTRPERMERERPKKEYDLDSEARDMRSASKALDSGRGVKEIGPQER